MPTNNEKLDKAVHYLVVLLLGIVGFFGARELSSNDKNKSATIENTKALELNTQAQESFVKNITAVVTDLKKVIEKHDGEIQDLNTKVDAEIEKLSEKVSTNEIQLSLLQQESAFLRRSEPQIK